MRVQIANKAVFNNALSSLFPQLLLSEVNGFTIDSRLVESGDVYLPIKGENVDGHDFISQAISSGASLIFSERSSTEEIVEVVKAAMPLGVRKVRISGGEPLLRKDLPELISYCKQNGISLSPKFHTSPCTVATETENRDGFTFPSSGI